MLSDTLDSISTSPDTGGAQIVRSSNYQNVQSLVCRLVAVSYAIAYASLYVQWDGLFGVDGLEPAGAFLKRNPKEASLTNLFGYRKQFGFSADTMADALCILGFVSSIVAAVGPCNIVTMALSWLPYISLYGVGQTFLSFQWDILLLEVGVLAVMWAPPRLFSSKRKSFFRGTVDAAFHPLQAYVYERRRQDTGELSDLVEIDSVGVPLCNAVYPDPAGVVRAPAAAICPASLRRGVPGHRDSALGAAPGPRPTASGIR